MSVTKSCSFYKEPKVNWIAFSYIVAEVTILQTIINLRDQDMD